MANPEHVAILRLGVTAWNQWRSENPKIMPDLSGANLSGADLFSANLGRANLSGAKLFSANLSGANLSGADLFRANLFSANLFSADLFRANLGRANLGRANLGRANGIIQCCASGYLFAGYWHDGQLMLRGGCHTFTVAEARKYWRGKPNRAEARAAVRWIVEMAKIKGWGK